MRWGQHFQPEHPSDLIRVVEVLQTPLEGEAQAEELIRRLEAFGYERALDDPEEEIPEDRLLNSAGILSCLEKLSWLDRNNQQSTLTERGASVEDGPTLSRTLRESLLQIPEEAQPLLETCALIRRLRETDERQALPLTGLLPAEFAGLTLREPGDIPGAFEGIRNHREKAREHTRSLEIPGSPHDILYMTISLLAGDALEDQLQDQVEDHLNRANRALRYFVATGLLAYGHLFDAVQTAELTKAGETRLRKAG